MHSPSPLEGRTALVTGAGRGIGKGIALALGRAGCRVAVNHIGSADEAVRTVGLLHELGVDAVAVQADVRRAADVTAMLDAIVARWGRLDVLVNNAGVQTWGPLVDVTEDEWDFVIDTNLKGCFLCTRVAARHMTTQRGGVVM
jgi:3-oxoacyl-[acyl-carrier protein] reductase